MDRETMKIKVCQLKLNSKHMVYAERIKNMIPKWEIKQRKHTSTLKKDKESGF